MKIQFREFKSHLSKSLNSTSVILLYGSNQPEIKDLSNEVTEMLCGKSGIEEMRVNKMTENALLREPQNFYTAVKTLGFFPGRQILIIDGVTDRFTKILASHLENLTQDDATLILLANKLKVTSTVRKMLEKDNRSICTAVYDDQRDMGKVHKIIESLQVKIIDENIVKFLKTAGNFSSADSFNSLIEKLEIYKFSDPNPVTFEEIELLLSDTYNPTIFEMIDCLVLGKTENTVLLLRQLFNNGIDSNEILNSTRQHFILLHKLSINTNNIDAILNQTYPPIFGFRRKQIIVHSRIRHTNFLEQVLNQIRKVDTALRSSSNLDIKSVLERCFLRIATLSRSLH